jgi:tetratricopeptide (TPR) repeat protein
VLGKLEELAPVERTLLAELPVEDARELARVLLPGGDTGTFERAAVEASGHPLFLHELAKHLDAPDGARITSASFEEMLASRIDQLTAVARRLLQVICVFGGPLTQEVAAIAAELTQTELSEAARILRAANLARTSGVGKANQIVVYHDRVREHVHASLDPETLEQLHIRLALALEQVGAAEHAPRALVRHAQAAGRLALAATYAQTAARHAVSSLAFDQAAEFFQIAIELGDHDRDSLRSLRIELATALVNAGRGAEAAAALIAAAETADPTTRMECRLRAAEQLLSSGHLDRGISVVGDLLAEVGTQLPATPKQSLIRLLYNRARLRIRGLRWKERHEREISDAELTRLEVLKAVGVGLNMVDTIRGADFQTRHLLLALELGEPLRIGRALAHEACYLSTQGERGRRRARQLIVECEQIMSRFPTPYLDGWVSTARALVHYMGGDFVAAQELLSGAEKVFYEQVVGKTWELNTVRLFQLFTLRHLGDIGTLRRLSNAYMRDARRRGDLLTETSMRRVRNIAWLAEGRAEDALLDLERAAWTPPGGAYHLQHYYELESRVELALFEGRAARALEQHAAEFAQLSTSLLVRVQIVRAISTWFRGRLAVAAAEEGHDRNACLALARQCARSLASEDAKYGVVWSSLLEGAILVQEGRDAAAIAVLAKATEAARARGMANCEAAARYRHGELVGGDEGAALLRDAQQSMRERGITAVPDQVQVIAPGCRRR